MRKTGICIRTETPHWIEMEVVGAVAGQIVNELVRVKLYDAECIASERHVAAIRAHAAREVKRRDGLSTCTVLMVAPRDWSPSLDDAFDIPPAMRAAAQAAQRTGA